MKRAYHGEWMDVFFKIYYIKYQMNSFFKMRLITTDDENFDFNQDSSIDYEEEYRSPGWDRYKKTKMLKWKK